MGPSRGCGFLSTYQAEYLRNYTSKLGQTNAKGTAGSSVIALGMALGKSQGCGYSPGSHEPHWLLEPVSEVM